MTYTLFNWPFFFPHLIHCLLILTLGVCPNLCAHCSFGDCHIMNAGLTSLGIRGIILAILVHSFNFPKLHSSGRNASLFMFFCSCMLLKVLMGSEKPLGQRVFCFVFPNTETLTCLSYCDSQV